MSTLLGTRSPHTRSRLGALALALLFATAAQLGAAGRADAGAAATGLVRAATRADDDASGATASAEEAATPRWWSARVAGGFEIDEDITGNIDLLYLPFSARFEAFPFAIEVTTSYLEVDGPSQVAAAGSLTVANRVPATRDAAVVAATPAEIETGGSGVGDTIVGASYTWWHPSGRWPLVEASLDLKIPTADADANLGTGNLDVILGVEVAKTIGPVSPFGSISLRVPTGNLNLPAVGLAPELDLALRPSFATSIGFSVRPFERLHLGVTYDWVQSPLDQNATNIDIDDRSSHELVPFASIELHPNLRLGPYLVIGLSETAPEIGYAAQLIVTY